MRATSPTRAYVQHVVLAVQGGRGAFGDAARADVAQAQAG